MKLFISIFLIFSHLFSTVGFSMEVHECDGQKSYTFFGISLNSLCQCDHESKDHKKSCCNDKKTIVKAEKSDKHINKVIHTLKILGDFEINNPLVFESRNDDLPKECSITFGTKHPPNNSPPLYILYNVFLI